MASHRIPPIYKPNIPIDILAKMNIVPSLEHDNRHKPKKKRSYRVNHIGSVPEDTSFFVQKKFPNRFSFKEFREDQKNSSGINCDEQMNRFARKANEIGLQT